MLGFCTGADEVQAKLMANSHADIMVADLIQDTQIGRSLTLKKGCNTIDSQVRKVTSHLI
jgi:hypothetical protein